MLYVFVTFIEKWIAEGRFPREELEIRWWILLAAMIVFGGLGIAVLIAVF